jgi:hypothetical protein
LRQSESPFERHAHRDSLTRFSNGRYSVGNVVRGNRCRDNLRIVRDLGVDLSVGDGFADHGYQGCKFMRRSRSANRGSERKIQRIRNLSFLLKIWQRTGQERDAGLSYF